MNFTFQSKSNLYAAAQHPRTSTLAGLCRAHFHLTTSHQLRAGLPIGTTRRLTAPRELFCPLIGCIVPPNEFLEHVRTVYA